MTNYSWQTRVCVGERHNNNAQMFCQTVGENGHQQFDDCCYAVTHANFSLPIVRRVKAT